MTLIDDILHLFVLFVPIIFVCWMWQKDPDDWHPLWFWTFGWMPWPASTLVIMGILHGLFVYFDLVPPGGTW
jgi:hypothetical protein